MVAVVDPLLARLELGLELGEGLLGLLDPLLKLLVLLLRGVVFAELVPQEATRPLAEGVILPVAVGAHHLHVVVALIFVAVGAVVGELFSGVSHGIRVADSCLLL